MEKIHIHMKVIPDSSPFLPQMILTRYTIGAVPMRKPVLMDLLSGYLQGLHAPVLLLMK